MQALDEYNQPNQIQVSEAALRLLPDAAAFEPWYLLTGMKHETVSRVYRLLSVSGLQGNAGSHGCLLVPPAWCCIVQGAVEASSQRAALTCTCCMLAVAG